MSNHNPFVICKSTKEVAAHLRRIAIAYKSSKDRAATFTAIDLLQRQQWNSEVLENVVNDLSEIFGTKDDQHLYTLPFDPNRDILSDIKTFCEAYYKAITV